MSISSLEGYSRRLVRRTVLEKSWCLQMWRKMFGSSCSATKRLWLGPRPNQRRKWFETSWTGATNASAEPFGSTWIGGWLSDLITPTKDQVYWFQHQVTEASDPWAFKKGCPQKRIAALELYGTLFLVLLLMDKQPTASCRLHIPLISDNQGNVYSILNNATRKMPNAVILMELVYQIFQCWNLLYQVLGLGKFHPALILGWKKKWKPSIKPWSWGL